MAVHGRSFVYRAPQILPQGLRAGLLATEQTVTGIAAHIQWQAQSLRLEGRVSVTPARVQWQAQALRRAGARTRSYPLGMQRGYPRREVLVAY